MKRLTIITKHYEEILRAGLSGGDGQDWFITSQRHTGQRRTGQGHRNEGRTIEERINGGRINEGRINEGRINEERRYETGTCEGYSCITRVSYAPGGKFAEALTGILEEAAATENPVYRHSPRLMDLANDLRDSPVHQENVRRLAEFLASNACVNIEGYITFRMTEYSYKLDLMTYGLIKKLRMTER